ncbi:MAG: MBL fold metallo-hydrolase [Gemmatimonadaceae bacterium]
MSAVRVKGRFQNPVPTQLMTPGALVKTLRSQLGGKEQRVPKLPLPIVRRAAGDFATPPGSGLRVTWLGHATVLIEIDGARVLVDPVFGERASPVQFAGPKRFHPPPLPLTAMPPLDVVLITHDHFDHLDRAAVANLANSASQMKTRFVTTLGVGARLEKYGVAATRITELDWDASVRVGPLTITATPARHFSGRGILDRNKTLWASWVIDGPRHRVFHSGDTGFFDGPADVGRTHGPFDLTMIKIGAYGMTWPDIHLTPEDALRVHQMLRGKLMLPIHWGTFNLAFHAWHEPPERLLAAASAAGAKLVMPRPGQSIEPSQPPPVDTWWRAL